MVTVAVSVWAYLLAHPHLIGAFLHQELEAALAAKEAEKVEVQKELHELQIRCRSNSGPISIRLRTSENIDHDAMQHIIEDLEAHGIGAC